MSAVGDKASEVAEALRAEHMAQIESGAVVLDKDDAHNVMMTAKKGIFSRVEFKWRESDKMVLDQIRAAANSAFVSLFDDAITLLDRLYEELRVPAVNENGIVRLDNAGRTIWEMDPKTDQPLERWEQLTGEDIERCLFDLTRLRFTAVPQVNELLLEAMFAKRISSDSYDDHYMQMIDGTIQDKTSRANRNSRQDTYHAFFRYILWSTGDVFVRELTNFQRVLERVRDWEVRGSWNK